MYRFENTIHKLRLQKSFKKEKKLDIKRTCHCKTANQRYRPSSGLSFNLFDRHGYEDAAMLKLPGKITRTFKGDISIAKLSHISSETK